MPKQLFLKIFISFWLVTVAQMATIIAIPSMIASPEALNPQQRKHHRNITAYLAKAPNLKKAINKVKHKIRTPRSFVKTLEDRSGKLQNIYIIDNDNNAYNGKRLPKDIYGAIVNHEEFPAQKIYKFKRWAIYGPYEFTNNGIDYQLYIRDFQHSERIRILRFLSDNPWIMFTIAMFISALFCSLLAWHLSRPIRSLERSAKQLASGDLTARADNLALRYHDEIGQLAKSFNEMADFVESTISGQQRLLGDISHEIRTPLTRLKLACAIHRRQFGDNVELKRIEQETIVIDKMLNQLLDLSRSTIANQHPIEETDFAFFMEEIIDNASFEARQANVNLKDNIQSDLIIAVQWDSLASAVENILRNAIRYAEQEIIFSAYAKDNQLIIDISDDGCGVEDEHLDNLFTPFYRVSTSRDRQSGGIGLGLAIAQEAISRHHGIINAKNNDNGGLTVTITLPLVRQ